ncbi:hypothetical protein ACNJYD_08870 [Bradyrhizobium sp. DASA03005]|uniref:hypothetical protein n=1 Tax=Bradyrhizobium sp. SPXBL-02 TaxID=3395912 RepID=UPI003F71E4B5
MPIKRHRERPWLASPRSSQHWKKGVGGAIIEIKPLAPASNTMHLKQVEVTLMVAN